MKKQNNNKLERGRLLNQYDNAFNRIRDKLDMADINIASNEEITITLEDLSIMIIKLKDFWNKNLKEDDL